MNHQYTMEIAKLRHAFFSAKSGMERLKVFQIMEQFLEEEDLGLALVVVSRQLDSEGHDPEKVRFLANRALNIFLDRQHKGITLPSPVGWACIVTCVLSVLGSACYKLKWYDMSLTYLEWAEANQNILEMYNAGYDPESDEYDQFLYCIHTIQNLLSRVKETVGRLDDCVQHFMKILEVTKKRTIVGTLDIGKAYMDVCQAYVVALNYHEAEPFAVKALDIYEKHLGSRSVEVASITSFLGGIYTALGKMDNDMGLIQKGFDMNELASSFFLSVGDTNGALQTEVRKAHILVQLGRYGDSINICKAVVSSGKAVGVLLALTLIYMATAYGYQENFEEARASMERAKQTLETLENHPYEMAMMLGRMALLHEKMNDIEIAISLLRRSLALPLLPQNFITQYFERLFKLINESSSMGEQAIQYLEEALERLKQSLGPTHLLVGYGYNKLGIVASKFNKLLQALNYHENAKGVLDVSLGPHDIVSLQTSQTISVLHSSATRHAEAIECQEKVVEGFKGLGPSRKDELDLAIMLLNKFKEAASGEVVESSESSPSTSLKLGNISK